MVKNNRILLPEGVHPKKYKLSLFPNMTDFTFLGSVNIALNVSKSVDSIQLHSSQLAFKAVEVTQNDKKTDVDADKIVFDKDLQTAKIPASLTKGQANLKIDFSGHINDKMHGFYRSTFKESSGKERVVGCTQFEPTDARKAFPCWDEPSHKAEFDLDITTNNEYVVLGNTPIKRESEAKKGMKKVEFETSPIMSTYLLAWFIGNYAHESVKTKSGVKISVYTPPEEIKKARWSLDVGKKSIDFFEEYFGIKYPLAKLDMIALNDFVNGAMENWGLVTYRDSAIYCDENSSLRSKEWVTHVVAHELAHQWFGNLVTMEWWSQLWLNEGFATFMQTLENAKVYPDWGIWMNFLTDILEPGLGLDALESSHPVEVEIEKSSEIDEVFDVISYKKGASVLRMLHEYIGEEEFRKGVSAYLRKFSYKNTESDDLWKSLSEASGKNVEEFMNIFTRKQGYPVVEVKIVAKEGNKYTFRLTQSRFLLKEKTISEENETIWHIPIKVDMNGETKWIMMSAKVMEIDYEVEDLSYIKFNSGSTGFFRVLHSPELMKMLQKAVKSSNLPTEDRFMMVSDTNAFLRAGKSSSKDLLDLLESYSEEQDQAVWSSIIDALRGIKKILRNTESEKTFERFAIGFVQKIHKKLGYEFLKDEHMRVKKLRGEMIRFLLSCKDEAATSFLVEKYKDLTENNKEVDSNIYGSVVSAAVINGDEKVMLSVQKLAETLKDPMRKVQSLVALGRSEDEEILSKALEYMQSGKVRTQDTSYVFNSVAYNPKGTLVAWNFLKKNYDTLRETYTHDKLFSRFTSVVGALTTPELIAEAEEFFKTKDTKGYEKNLSQSFESAKLFVKLKEREFSNVEKWLQQKGL